MAMNTLPITELRSLLSVVSSHGKQHLDEVEADLLQTNDILSEAIEKLGTSFMALHETVTKQQATLEALMAEHPLAGSEVATLDSYKQKIGEEVNAAVTCLQFQDMASQLIGRTVKRVNGLRDLFLELAAHGQEIDPEYEHGEIAKFLDAMNSNFNASSNALSGGLKRSVNQQDMQTGEIELF